MDRLAIERGVHALVLLEGVGAGLDDEVSVGRVKLALHLLAAVDQLSDIDLGGDSELSTALQALVHTLGNHLAHASQRHALPCRRRRCSSGRRCGSRCGCRSLTSRVDNLLHILARHPATRTGTDYAGNIDLVFLGQLARRRGDWRTFTPATGRSCYRSRTRGCGRGSGCRFDDRCAATVASSDFGNILARLGNYRHRQAYRHHCFNQIQEFSDGTGDRRLDFIEHLLGLNLEKRLAGVDGITLGLEPLLDCALDHGQAEFGHNNFYRHDSPSSGVRRAHAVRPYCLVPTAYCLLSTPSFPSPPPRFSCRSAPQTSPAAG